MPHQTGDVSGLASAEPHCLFCTLERDSLQLEGMKIKPMLLYRPNRGDCLGAEVSQGVQPHRLLNIRNKPLADEPEEPALRSTASCAFTGCGSSPIISVR